jgi:hypothetical protein
VFPMLSLGVGFGGPAQAGPLPSRSTMPTNAVALLPESLPNPRLSRFDLVNVLFLSCERFDSEGHGPCIGDRVTIVLAIGAYSR